MLLYSFSVAELRTLQKNKALKILFDIGADVELSTDDRLLFEVGKDYCSYAYWNPSTNTIHHLQFISFEEVEAEKDLLEIINSVKNNRFDSVVICSAFAQALLVPTKYFNNNYQTLDIIYDQQAQEYKHDAIPEWQMITIYSLPQKIAGLFQDSFSNVQFLHAYTPAIKMYNGYVADNQLSVHFTPQHFRVLLKKDTAIQLAQTYWYKTPLDVIYYLLKICYEFEMEQSSVHLILSGLIEKNSTLFGELYQYFTNIHFAHPPEIKLPDNSYPQHFFTSIYNLATCVS